MRPEDFGRMLVGLLRKEHPEAGALVCRAVPKGAEVGVVEDEVFVPVLRLTAASPACNVMTLLVRHGRGWAPTLQRGTPAELAAPLNGPLKHLWSLAVIAAQIPNQT